ncbi:phosphonate ABC transporter ATP-binding protein [Dechloromonas denitrificans]|uniref:phosphonate ABC transporter ATP-binding protein n=1 Tax=Dechloromonas denitrificans TaxID=281362 RepID=UPI001CF8036A|nr:ATP-binding cassette domain-containing protein [Dechloromonas denitrificans]UCV03407.1 ATP-binding cassette domain-containing protein [Dechloromonas denitrificans]
MSLALDGVGLTHANGFTALAGITLKADQGEHIALIGPSGAGKTSLISVLGTALAPTTGQARVLGTRLEAGATTPGKALRRRIGTVHQAPPIPARQRVVTAVLAGKLGQWPAWKALASLLYPLDVAGARAALGRVDLADKLFARCDQLSGGQLQRVGIARVLYQQADLILADEPVSALDPALALATIRLLIAEATARGATLVASLHAVDLAVGNFSRIVGIKTGGIAFDLPAGEVTVPLLHELYASEGEELPVQAHEPHFLLQTTASDAANRAACC